MIGSAKLIPLALTAFVATFSAAPLYSGTPQIPPTFVAPAPGGVVDPVFVPNPKPDTTPGASASNAATKLIVAELDEARSFCRRMPSEEYTIDCLGDALQKIANDLPSGGDYGDAKSILGDTAQKLRSLARENASTELPTGRVGVPNNSSLRSSTPLTPVARERLPQANASALAILEEAETTLLRSTANSQARKVHYQRISNALGSNKVLLRSA